MFQTGETVALKKVALRKLEDGIPNQALREIKALQEIEDNQYVSVLISQTYYFTTSVLYNPPSYVLLRFLGCEAEGCLSSRHRLRPCV